MEQTQPARGSWSCSWYWNWNWSKGRLFKDQKPSTAGQPDSQTGRVPERQTACVRSVVKIIDRWFFSIELSSILLVVTKSLLFMPSSRPVSLISWRCPGFALLAFLRLQLLQMHREKSMCHKSLSMFSAKASSVYFFRVLTLVLGHLLTKFNKHRTCLVSLRARRPSGSQPAH